VRNPYAGGLLIDGIDGGTGAAYDVSLDATGHPVASNLRECYLDLAAQGKQNEIPCMPQVVSARTATSRKTAWP
jgi:glutamate synthase (NADPH/NADH) large chain